MKYPQRPQYVPPAVSTHWLHVENKVTSGMRFSTGQRPFRGSGTAVRLSERKGTAGNRKISQQVHGAVSSSGGRTGKLSFAALKLSHGVGGMNALIAATALEHGTPIYIFNVKHFAAVSGLQVVVPFVR